MSNVNIEQVFAGFDNSEIFGKGQFFAPDFDGVLKPLSVKAHNGFKGLSFIFECEIVQSNGTKDAKGKEHDPVGAERSWVVKMGSENRNAMGDIKALVFALLGVDPRAAGKPQDNPRLHQDAGTIIKAACDPNYARGVNVDPNLLLQHPTGQPRYVRLVTFQKATKPKVAGGPEGVFTVHNWSPYVAPAPAPAQAAG